MEKTSFFNAKGMTAIFAAVVFLTGFLLLDKGSFTGNAILENQSSLNPFALIGLFLILCSVALAFYALKRN
jgi:hypothetical protein